MGLTCLRPSPQSSPRIAPAQSRRPRRWGAAIARIRAHDDPAVFITLRDEADASPKPSACERRKARCRSTACRSPSRTISTSPACRPPPPVPAFAYAPAQDATAVARLRAAGAIVIGKTNLDQFATGLVGVRSPYGVPRNPFEPDLIPGGSSSGSAVAVAAGLVPLALGTDTAGSGRVPAMLNNIVGLKPTLGLVSTAGVVPACRTLDCVSVFALTVDDALTALPRWPAPRRARSLFARPCRSARSARCRRDYGSAFRAQEQRMFFGDDAAERPMTPRLKRSRRAWRDAHRDRFRAVL